MNLYNRMINGTSAPEDLVEMIKRFEDPRINEAVLKEIHDKSSSRFSEMILIVSQENGVEKLAEAMDKGVPLSDILSYEDFQEKVEDRMGR